MEIMYKAVKETLKGLITLYQYLLSPFLSPSCRHIPTCSSYAKEAIELHGVTKGLYLSIKRIFRCRPGGTSGYDPVPPRDEK
tara:strand:- start:93 stop:338 length:246 start_codon:yes stop_codon:yes gene_type:complete